MSINIKPLGLTHVIVSGIITIGLITLTAITSIYHTMSGSELMVVWIVIEPTASYFTSRIDLKPSSLTEQTTKQ
jgi:hypothetical protein